MLTPEQQNILSQTLGSLGGDYTQALGSFIQPQSQEQMQETFQQMFVDPSLQAFEQSIAPAIQQRFVDANAGSSSALNQALAQSAKDLSTSIGSQYGQFAQQQQANQLAGLGQFQNLLTGQTFSPMIHQQQGILGDYLKAVSSLAATGAAMSSKDVKENIRDYKKALETLKELTVKQYDYKEEVGGQKDKVGFIAEDLPKEFQSMQNGILHADVYGLVALAINAIKVLSARVDKLQEAQ